MQEQDHQHMDDIIRSSFDKRSKGAPDSLWGNLSAALEADATAPADKKPLVDSLDKKVKESFDSLNERAPGRVWPAINRQLNLDRVWEGISHELDKPNPLFRPATRWAAAILLLLFSSIGAYLYFPPAAGSNALAVATDKSTNASSTTANAATAKPSNVSQQPSTVVHGVEKDEIFKVEEKTPSQQAVVADPSSFAQNKAMLTGERGSKASTAGAIQPGAIQPGAIQPGAIQPESVRSGIIHPGSVQPQKEQPVYAAHSAEEAAVLPTGNSEKSGAAVSLPESAAPFADESQASTALSSALAVAAQEQKAEVVKGKGSVSTNGQALLNDVEEGNGSGKSALVTPASAEKASAAPDEVLASVAAEKQRENIPYDIASLPFSFQEKQYEVKAVIVAVDTAGFSETLDAAGVVEREKKQLPGQARFSAGPVLVYNNTWLLNNETKSSYDKNSLIATDPTYKQNWGLALNYQLTPKSQLASEFYISGKAGQQYKMYRNGEYQRKELELQYYKLHLQYQLNLLHYGKGIPSWLTVKAGGYGGYLHDKLGELRTEESRYAKFDYGLKLALGQEHKIGRLIMGYGVGAERGLSNVFRGTENLPANFNKTYILNVGTYLSMRYAF